MTSDCDLQGIHPSLRPNKTSQRYKVRVRNGSGNVWTIRVIKDYILDTLKNSWAVQNLLPKTLCGMYICNKYMCAYVSVSVVCMRVDYSTFIIYSVIYSDILLAILGGIWCSVSVLPRSAVSNSVAAFCALHYLC